MSAKQFFYLGAAVAGFLVPWYFNLQHFQVADDPTDGVEFVTTAMANPAATSLVLDLIIGATVFLFWMVPEARRLGMKHWWVYIVWTFAVAFASAFPLFMFMRERKMRRAPAGRTRDRLAG